MARRRKGEEGHDNAERWLLTYADMITLLMAFFIMMYSMSVLNLAKFHEVAFSIRSGFGGVLKGGEHLMISPAGQAAAVHLNPLSAVQSSKSLSKERQYQTSYNRSRQQLISYLITHNLQDKVEISQESRGLVVTLLSDGLLFDRGSAVIKPETDDVLNIVADMLKTVPNGILVEGHTCDLPISSAVFPSNWELSGSRASSIVRYFIDKQHLPATRLTAIGYADTRPRQPNDSEAHRAQNRRVAIVLLDNSESWGMPEKIEISRPEKKVNDVKPNLPKVWE